MICKDCAWEADYRRFHGNSVKIAKGMGHGVCTGCDCRHQAVKHDAPPLPEVEDYGEALQRAFDGHANGGMDVD